MPPSVFSVPLVFWSLCHHGEDNSRIPAQIAGVWCVSREVVDEDTPERHRGGRGTGVRRQEEVVQVGWEGREGSI